MFIVNGVSGSSLHCINFGAATDPVCGSGGMFIQSHKFGVGIIFFTNKKEKERQGFQMSGSMKL